MTINPPKVWQVVPYRAEWPELFAREAELLADVFASTGAVIEHIGSTAVPGLGAKPIIDIMIGVGTLTDAESRVRELAAAQYEYVPEYEAELADESRTGGIDYTERKSPFITRVLAAAREWRNA